MHGPKRFSPSSFMPSPLRVVMLLVSSTLFSMSRGLMMLMMGEESRGGVGEGALVSRLGKGL